MAIKILLADDSLTIQKVVELTFSDAETRLMAVGSGDRAVQALDDFQPDIVLADVVMPGLTGYDVCESVKQRPGGVFVPVVLLTGTFEPFDRARAERVGSDAIVTKPFDSHALQGLVRDLVVRARANREEAEVAAAAAALAPPPVPEPPPTMILSVAELEEQFPPQAPFAEDVGATQAMPTLALPESFPPPFAVEEPVLEVEDSNFKTMAMRIPTADELAAAAPMEIVEPAPTYFSPPLPPPPDFQDPELVSLDPPPPSPFYRPDAAHPVPPPPPAFYEPEAAPYAEPAPFEPEAEQAHEPFLVEMESPEQIAPPETPVASFEIVPEPAAAPDPDEIEVALYDVAEEKAAAESPEVAKSEEPAFDLPVEEPVAPPAEPIAVADETAEEVVIEEASLEPFPEMDELVPVAETEAAPWDDGPTIEIPPPPPELSGAPEDTDGTEPITRDIEADLEAFEASGRVTRRPEIWERHAALIGEETPTGINMHGSSVPEELPTPAMEDPSSSELEAMAAAARIEDLSAMIPSSTSSVTAAATVPPPSGATAEAAVTTAPLGSIAASALSDADVDRIARRVVQLLSDKAVRDIAWEVVPEYAERLVRERIAEVERAG